MKLHKLLLFTILFLTARSAFSQEARLEGRVTADNGNPIAGATVVAMPGKLTVSTDMTGLFHIAGVHADYLKVSCIGYNSREVKLPAQIPLVIVLTLKNSQVDEVIVQAYGTTTQRKNTGNITRIDAQQIADQPVSNPLAALEGRVPGVTVTQSSGIPGSSFNVQVRGQTVLDGGLSASDPLIVIDGVFFEPGNQPANQLRSAVNNQFDQGGMSPLNSISPDDIQSIEVLKDAAATAIYGSRGANGVILITTKKGRSGKTVFTGSVYSGAGVVPYTMPLLNTSQYVAMRKEAFRNDSIAPSADPSDPGYAPDIMLWDTSRYTNFRKLLTSGTANITDAQGSVSGGTVLTQFLLSGSYHHEGTVFPGDFGDTRGGAHLSINYTSANKKFSMVFSAGFSEDRSDLPSTDLTQYITLPPNLLLHMPGGGLAFSEDGVSYATVNNIVNPLAILLQTNTAISKNLYSNLQLTYTILSGLKATVSLGYSDYTTGETALFPEAAVDPYVASYTPASANFANTELSSWLVEPQLNYVKTIGRGQLNVLLGGTLEQKTSASTVIQATNYTSDLLLNNPAAAGLVTASIGQSVYRYEAVFGRLDYDWAGKYIIDVTFRRDGSSRFGPDQQFANFGALGGAWIFSDEQFMQSFQGLSFGKLRASYGLTGNDQIGDYNYLSLYQSNPNTYGDSPTLLPAKLYNPDFHWQTNRKMEFGIELGWLKDNILFTASWYRERSSDQLVNYPLPRTTGFSSVVENLPALVQNTGFEFTLNTKNVNNKDFRWTSSFNMTIPSNKLLAFPGLDATSYKDEYVVGQPLTVIYGYKYTGVDPRSGVYTFQDVNHDGVLNTADYQLLGNLDPKFYGGLLNSISYKQFQLDFFLEFKKQVGRNYLSQLFNSIPGTVANQPSVVLGRWQQPGDQSNIQLFTAGNNQAALIAANTELDKSDAIYGDASYVRLKNVSLSWHLPVELAAKLGISSGKLFINAQNLLTISGFEGLDPETQNFEVLPPLRTITAGIQFSL